ncbi:MAG: DUF4738 domain-containing protein [Prevotella sp.]|nr:DUF4738 domain-containing protein [Prevotella sp.]
MKIKHLAILFALLSIVACKGKQDGQAVDEDVAMLAGVWQNADDDSYVFRIEGDTIYYADRTLLPVHFCIRRDTMLIEGATTTKYVLEQITPNVLRFRNASGEMVRLYKAAEKVDDAEFYSAEETMLEVTQQLTKSDTVVVAGTKRYHCYVQVNPTTFKVVKSEMNNEGMDVGKIYYDNIVNVAVYDGARRVYFHDFKKQEFAAFVPEEIMPLCILSDIVYASCSSDGIVFEAQLRVPESASSYIACIRISPEGGMSLEAKK